MLENNEIGTAEIGRRTGLSQRQIRRMAAAGKIPWPVTRTRRRGFWFERDRLAPWIEEHAILLGSIGRPGRKGTKHLSPCGKQIHSARAAAERLAGDLQHGLSNLRNALQ